jgi:hypothetical protein
VDVLASGYVVRPDVAAKQFAVERTDRGTVGAVAADGDQSGTTSDTGDGAATPTRPRRPVRFHATASLSPDGLSSQTGKIAEEVVQHLASLFGSEVSLTLEIHADAPAGIPEQAVRTVSENCRTLKIQFDFEEELGFPNSRSNGFVPMAPSALRTSPAQPTCDGSIGLPSTCEHVSSALVLQILTLQVPTRDGGRSRRLR